MASVTVYAEPGHAQGVGNSTACWLGANYTGRNILLDSSYKEAKSWIERYEFAQKPEPVAEARFLSSISQLRPTSCVDTLYRGLYHGPPDNLPDFGPPPDPDKVSRGRYNREHAAVLYLCTSEEGVAREKSCPPPGKSLWIQRYNLPPTVRLFDGRQLPPDSLAAAVFYLVESMRAGPEPTIGARLAELLEPDYEGINVPGVRGDSAHLYSNVVIFQPTPNWTNWLDDRPYQYAKQT